MHGTPTPEDVEALLAADVPRAIERMDLLPRPVSYAFLSNAIRRLKNADRLAVAKLLAPRLEPLTGEQLLALLNLYAGPDADKITVLRLFVEDVDLTPAETLRIFDQLISSRAQVEAAEILIASKPLSSLGPLPALFKKIMVQSDKTRVAQALIRRNVQFEPKDVAKLLTDMSSDSFALGMLEALAPHTSSLGGKWQIVMQVFESANARMKAFEILRKASQGFTKKDAMALIGLMDIPDTIRRAIHLVGEDMPKISYAEVTYILSAFEPGWAFIDVVSALRPHMESGFDQEFNMYLLERYAGHSMLSLQHYIVEYEAQRQRQRMEEKTGLRLPQQVHPEELRKQHEERPVELETVD